MKVEEEVKTSNNFRSNQNEILDMGLGLLMELKENDLSGNDGQYRDTVQTLFKIVANLISKSMDPQVRRLNRTNKAIQAKILAFPSACRFLELVRHY